MFNQKRLALQLLAILALSLNGCGSSQASEPVNSTSNVDVNSTPSSPSNNDSSSIIGTNDHYNEANFISSSKEVHETKLVTYDGPEFMNTSEKVKVKVNNEDLFVYETRVNHQRKFSWTVSEDKTQVAMFDFEGKVHIDIEVSDETITSATVAPLVYGINPTISNNVISFDLSYSDNYVIEYNGDSSKAIQLFANPLEENPISKEVGESDDSILYIGPGVYKADAIPIESNKTVYLAGGAYVYGQIRAEGLENITIRGRGIFSGEIYSRKDEATYTLPIEIRTSKNVKIEGVSFFDPAGWTITLYKSEDISIENVKIITARQNGDGISVQSCSNVNVKGGYVRTWDDSLVVKNVDRGSTSNVTFDGVNVWTDLAQSMEVGYETYGPSMEDITFKNITVIHNFHKAVISMHNSDDAMIKNVTYQNITVEDGQMLGDDRNDNENDFLIDFTIAYSIDWTKSKGDRGTVENVTIDNVKVYNMLDSIICRVNGENPNSLIKNVKISNIEVEGKKVNNLTDIGLVANTYTENVRIENTNEDILGAKIELPYVLNLTSNEVNKTKYETVSQEGVLVPTFSYSKGELPYVGVETSITPTITSGHSAGTRSTDPATDGTGEFVDEGSSSANACDNNTSTYYRSGNWQGVDDEFASLTIEFNSNKKVGLIRVLGNSNNKFYNTYTIAIYGRRVKAGVASEKYTRILPGSDYEMSPNSGNYIDINITTQEYAGLQLRLFKTNTITSPEHYEIANVLFYPPALSYNCAIVESTEHNDVYLVGRVNDGQTGGTSYYESKKMPATIVYDLGNVYSLNAFVMCLPPSLLWSARTQKIQILVSDSNLDYSSAKPEFKEVVAPTDFLFDPQTGNINIVKLDSSIQARYVKIVISSNDNVGGYGAQLSEFSVYGE